jgi:hypothetical protein
MIGAMTEHLPSSKAFKCTKCETDLQLSLSQGAPDAEINFDLRIWRRFDDARIRRQKINTRFRREEVDEAALEQRDIRALYETPDAVIRHGESVCEPGLIDLN